MALRAPSLFLYGFEITPNNRFISFQSAPAVTRVAALNLGFYSLTSLGEEIVRAMTAVDPLNLYTYSVNRSIAGGTQNRFTISTGASYFRVLFSSGNPSNPASLIGFNASDYIGATTYTGSQTCGKTLIPNQLGYTYLSPKRLQKNFGALNVSTSGEKEAITFTLQNFWQVQFKYITEALADNEWNDLIQWMIKQKQLEFTPEITSPNVFYVGTLEEPSKGLEFNMSEMLPQFPFQYSTPLMKFRVRK